MYLEPLKKCDERAFNTGTAKLSVASKTRDTLPTFADHRPGSWDTLLGVFIWTSLTLSPRVSELPVFYGGGGQIPPPLWKTLL